MKPTSFEIESEQLFSKSRIWQLNRDFYQSRGVSAFSEGIVPHHLTSNALVGKTYAELIFGFLKDLAFKEKTKEIVYILELGAGHGRLAFHILTHLEKLIQGSDLTLPPFCYVLSDIVEKNLSFFRAHPQFQEFFQKGILDLCYFDALKSQDLDLQYAQKSIHPKDLKQPIVAIANYFFDSIPQELFHIKDGSIARCSVALGSSCNPDGLKTEELIKNLRLTYSQSPLEIPRYENAVINEIFEDYKKLVTETYVFFPENGMQCMENLKSLSSEGLLLLSLDKGFHELRDLENRKQPSFVTHGSFSFWVNYHALGAFCEKQGGKALFPSLSTFHLELGALVFLKDPESYKHSAEAYQKFVDDFGPDDFNSFKHLSYSIIDKLGVKELIALFRLSGYDSTYFIRLFPRLKQLLKSITHEERIRISETMHQVWSRYFSIGEEYDLAYEIGGVFYDMGFYKEALGYFQSSDNLHGHKADTYYNIALTHYQLRQDKLFFETIAIGKKAFPDFALLKELEGLDVS